MIDILTRSQTKGKVGDNSPDNNEYPHTPKRLGETRDLGVKDDHIGNEVQGGGNRCKQESAAGMAVGINDNRDIDEMRKY